MAARPIIHEVRHHVLRIVIDTNVFVAAGFNPRSAAVRILAGVREGRFQLIWNEPTRRETEMILRRIPHLDWERVADLFRPETEFTGPVDPQSFVLVPDPEDRKLQRWALQRKRRSSPMTTTFYPTRMALVSRYSHRAPSWHERARDT